MDDARTLDVPRLPAGEHRRLPTESVRGGRAPRDRSMKTVGIVGLPGAGVTTIFTALTSVEGSASQRTHQAVVPVPDERLTVLGRLHDSKKIVHATLRFVEAGGLVRRGARGTGALSAELLGLLRECDALLAVVRAFAAVEPADPVRELA